MEAMFNNEGGLVIKRGGKWVDMFCFHAAHPDTDTVCGDWCPQISEPIRQHNGKLKREETVRYGTSVVYNKEWWELKIGEEHEVKYRVKTKLPPLQA